ncbi:coproporphyrinogen III oxidase [Clostridium luticellarii]|jgi:oxygen-independent coproporphyrinogen-3 oxidase|nr:coproporphyrinogen III oxidase [Clostridium luticellarii]MCI1944285.1 coproporphyrinogen III oxidase [Clostridium luticellarii]MCI1967781.1 coproporphyrinogen III oxidase [Clostridium luticellarii]MCI1994659.1 coproporphyrinogen III oxidase [Clostridium luticellarii]MCI2038844.1 coproporphyrinogen III oxidase [Clostridium luticellarii]
MKIKVKLNPDRYRYQVFQIINLFYELTDIIFVKDENWDFRIEEIQNTISVEDRQSIHKIKFQNDLTDNENIKKAVFLYFSQRIKRRLPWGTLIGIRPSKIAFKLIKEGKSQQGIVEYFHRHFCCENEKAQLCIDIANGERKVVNTSSKNVSVYIGMPFCPTRCIYCSFASNSIEKCKNIVGDYLNGLTYELRQISSYIKKHDLNIECVYFGGGTPTSISDEKFEKIMNEIYNDFVCHCKIKEFDVECGRPDSITLNKLEIMKKYKVNRISINPQTMNDDTLKFIGRRHSVKDIREKFHMARQCGFDNINMDIIVGLPGEGMDHMNRTCEEIERLSPDNLTVHGLSLKRGSRLYENIMNNVKYSIAGSRELNSMYERAAFLARTLNMKPYYMYRQKNMVGNMENVGYRKSSNSGIYNIEMIEEQQTIIACGADAVTKVIFLDENRLERQANVKDVREYVNRVDEMVQKKIKLLDTLY